MRISKEHIAAHNEEHQADNEAHLAFLDAQLSKQGVTLSLLLDQLKDFQVAIPSWALGAGGTRFGRFSIGGEPGSLEDKLDDVGVIHALTQTAGAISLHIPWDIPKDTAAIKQRAEEHGIVFDAMNSNTFQDQQGQPFSYKHGSLSNSEKASRQLAIDHNIEVIQYGQELGSNALTVWLADGASFPGQNNFRKALQNTQESLHEIYSHLPQDWKLLVEYKPYEPNFYSTVIQDWGTSLMLAEGCGERAHTLVDLGHHLPNTNIEQIVATLMAKGRLGGFHFNDSKYGDDDLTCGSIKPYQLFLIFNELVYGMQNNDAGNPPLAWMIDASHNVKDPIEDLMQSLEAISIAYAQALLVDQQALEEAQRNHDVTMCQEILQRAYRTDVRPIVAAARAMAGGALDPLGLYRKLDVRGQLIGERGKTVVATGL
ncbi:TIM barrel protein [Marinoscillum furvescens]|uniref:L-rhamnose isomerase/sugar isomerase n=1 Tax=Marinoscillum furvescens DSM 4134 TaxID=1122208 RepID=A0A3D9LIM8_MARFU|nr:TIM barrel protein [Marinoscillum furvescens]REE05526.1 L-rhamnose isomerase/sugar isomerase [Marinoscillum furvescens DSM 4134]